VVSDVSVNSVGISGDQDIIAQVRALMQAKGVPPPRKSTDAPKGAPAILPAPQSVQAAVTPPPAAAAQPAPAAAWTAVAEADEIGEESEAAGKPKGRAFSSLRSYVLLSVLLTALGLGAVVRGNQLYGSEMYGWEGMVPAAEAASQGLNYAVFDLNLNIRHLRDETVKRMTETPDVVLLGASHWQEAHAGLVTDLKMYNSHIHRDYWEDPMGVVGIYERYGRLPKRMIVSIRDKQFTPVAARTDYLWEPGIPYYQTMAKQLGFETEPFWKTLPYQRVRALFSLSMLFENFTRWYNAVELPHASWESNFKHLDTLLPDGSILWSDDHKRIFTAERRSKMSHDFAAASLAHPPVIDPKGVEAFHAMFRFLKEKGVQVYLVHPPFNPEFYDAVQGSKYMEGLNEIEKLTDEFARQYGFKVFGSYNPHKLGCTAEDYIDAEHANPRCLKGIFDQFNDMVRAEGESS
jgi:hypothetical protein